MSSVSRIGKARLYLLCFAGILSTGTNFSVLGMNMETSTNDLVFSLRLAREEELSELVRIDDAAGTLFEQAGIVFDFGWEHPYALAEVARWKLAIDAKLAHVAANNEGDLLAFLTLQLIDGAPYIDQLSVHPTAMRRGIGSALVQRAIEWSGNRPLWLTTYSHVPWNAPYYSRRFGFEAVAETECGPELKAIMEAERSILPQPEYRTAMVRRVG